MTTAVHPNVDRLRALADGFNDGSSMSMWSPEAVWHIGGRSPVAGTYRGMDEIRGCLARMGEISGGTLRVEEVHETLADDTFGVIVFRTSPRRGERSLDVTIASALRWDGDGRLCEAWFVPNDQRAYDEFFTS